MEKEEEEPSSPPPPPPHSTAVCVRKRPFFSPALSPLSSREDGRCMGREEERREDRERDEFSSHSANSVTQTFSCLLGKPEKDRLKKKLFFPGRYKGKVAIVEKVLSCPSCHSGLFPSSSLSLSLSFFLSLSLSFCACLIV